MSMTHEQIRKMLSEGCSEEVFAKIRCPKCGGGVLFVVHPNERVFFIRCVADNTHLSMHGENLNPPEWWGHYLQKKGWY